MARFPSGATLLVSAALLLATACSPAPSDTSSDTAQNEPARSAPERFTPEDPTAAKSWIPDRKPKERLNAEVQIPRAPNEPGGCITVDAPVGETFKLAAKATTAAITSMDQDKALAELQALTKLAATPAEKIGAMRLRFLYAATNGDRPEQLQALTALATTGQLCRDELEKVVAAIDQLKKPPPPAVPQSGP